MPDESTQSIFELVLARPVSRPGGADPALVHVWWSAPNQGDRLVQVYVDGQLYDVTLWPDERAMWLVLDRRQAHRIELLGISRADSDGLWTPRPHDLTGWQPAVNGAADITVVRDQRLPVETNVTVDVDGQLMDRAPLWSADVARGGFGALFGEGGFGLDAAAGPGLGGGALGCGPLGSDGFAWHWHRTDLAPGERTITLSAKDKAGRVVAPALHRTITIEQLPSAADQLTMSDGFVLQWL